MGHSDAAARRMPSWRLSVSVGAVAGASPRPTQQELTSAAAPIDVHRPSAQSEELKEWNKEGRRGGTNWNPDAKGQLC